MQVWYGLPTSQEMHIFSNGLFWYFHAAQYFNWQNGEQNNLGN